MRHTHGQVQSAFPTVPVNSRDRRFLSPPKSSRGDQDFGCEFFCAPVIPSCDALQLLSLRSIGTSLLSCCSRLPSFAARGDQGVNLASLPALGCSCWGPGCARISGTAGEGRDLQTSGASRASIEEQWRGRMTCLKGCSNREQERRQEVDLQRIKWLK